MPFQLPDNPLAAVAVVAMLCVFVWGGAQVFPAWRRDWMRNRHMEEIEVTEAVKRLASETLEEVRLELVQARDELKAAREELRRAHDENSRLNSRISEMEQREAALHRHIGSVEAWAASKVPQGIAASMPMLTDLPTNGLGRS